MVNLAKNIKHQRVLMAAVLLVLIVFAAAFFITQQDTTNEEPASQLQPASVNEDPAVAQEPSKAPEKILPKECVYEAVVSKVLGDNLTKEGRVSKTKNSDLIECTYRKNDKIATIQRYEYQSEADAKADLSKVAPKGYAGQTKGKYNVVVSVVTPSGADISAADSILKSSTQSL